MAEFNFAAAINIRAYGSIRVEADSIDAAKAAIAADGFDMKANFTPNGGGDDDFDWDHSRPEIYLSYVTDEDENETELDEELPTAYELQKAKITVFVVSTCIPERGEAPCIPDVFATEAEAIAHLEKILQAEWEHHGGYDDETGEKRPYPGNWEDAQAQILESFDDGSWGSWQITSHQITIGKES